MANSCRLQWCTRLFNCLYKTSDVASGSFSSLFYYGFACCSKNGQDFGGSYFHKVNPNLEMGVLADFLSASKGSCPYQGSIAAKYAASPDTALKAKVAVSGEVGLSVQQKISNSKYFCAMIAICIYCSELTRTLLFLSSKKLLWICISVEN